MRGGGREGGSVGWTMSSRSFIISISIKSRKSRIVAIAAAEAVLVVLVFA